MKRSFFTALIAMGLGSISIAHAGGSARPDLAPPSTVESVDLKRYQGMWFEVARYPNRFQKDCFDSSAEYSLRDDGKIKVVNRCVGVMGKKRESDGTAWSTNPPANSKLKVRFFWPFSGDYWVLALDKDYQWVIVGGPDYKYLWILARQVPMNDALLENLLKIVTAKGYDKSKLLFDPHNAHNGKE